MYEHILDAFDTMAPDAQAAARELADAGLAPALATALRWREARQAEHDARQAFLDA